MNRKANYYLSHVCFHAVKRGDWILKVSVNPHRVVMVIASHISGEYFATRFFTDYTSSANWIEQVVASDAKALVNDWTQESP